MDMKYEGGIERADAPRAGLPRRERRSSPELLAIVGIVASFWVFVILRLIADAHS